MEEEHMTEEHTDGGRREEEHTDEGRTDKEHTDMGRMVEVLRGGDFTDPGQTQGLLPVDGDIITLVLGLKVVSIPENLTPVPGSRG